MPAHASRPSRILIGDDDVAIAFDLEDRLRAAGFATIGPALDAGQVGELLGQETGDDGLDGAVIDVGMLGPALEATMAPLFAKRIPVLFMTGYGDSALPPLVLAGDHVMKPFGGDKVVEWAVSALVRRRQAQDLEA